MSRTSRFISRVLRHAPQDAGLTLDGAGWAGVSDLLRGMRAAGHPITRQELDKIVAENDKRRFTLSPDGKRIRAAQGHSIEVDLGLSPSRPPDILFHGTATSNLDSIFKSGLVPGRRKHVHLSPDPATARSVGERHGKAVVLAVNAADLHDAGHPFFQADNGVWLTASVPISHISFHSS